MSQLSRIHARQDRIDEAKSRIASELNKGALSLVDWGKEPLVQGVRDLAIVIEACEQRCSVRDIQAQWDAGKEVA